jgi:small subunit ribosomal protein S21
LTKVVVELDESFESALKRFKKSCEKAGHSEKPSVRRTRTALVARTKARRRERTAD